VTESSSVETDAPAGTLTRGRGEASWRGWAPVSGHGADTVPGHPLSATLGRTDLLVDRASDPGRKKVYSCSEGNLWNNTPTPFPLRRGAL
jgi:hypothetical protein